MNDPHVSQIKRLLDRIQSWRQCARETSKSLCRLMLTNATRSITTTLSKHDDQSVEPNFLTSNEFSAELIMILSNLEKNLHHLSSDIKALILLHRLVNYLEADLVVFVHQLPDWSLFNLVKKRINGSSFINLSLKIIFLIFL